jgi:carbohydrate binding protein with CBM6 domain/glycosyl hydrolase family 64 (putative beta-1,3-glucanase)/ricin-type beta-trefoil lectin protein
MGFIHIQPLSAGARLGRRSKRAALMIAAVSTLTLAGVQASAYAAAEGPYGGTAAAVPGTVQAANYDTGGQGVAYNVSSVNGTANSYRSDGVDLEACTDTGCGYDLGWTAAGQWFKYTVNVASAGTYSVSMRLASPYGETDGLHIANSAGTSLTGPVAVPNTGGYQNWTTVTASLTLPAGVQTLTVDQDSNGWNLHYLTFAAAGGTGINTSSWYEVINENSGLCASAAGGGTANGTAVEQLACTGATSQLWQFVPVASGFYEVLNENAQSAGEAWNINGGVGATGNGALLQTWAYGGTGNTNELFSATQVTGGYYNFKADNSGLCVDTPGASTASGVQLQQYTCNGTGAQEFSLVVPSGGGGGGTGFGGFPSSFWGNTASIPSASGAIEFDFLNATNGQYPDSEVYWSVNGVTESIAQSPYYTMTSCSACRINFYLGSPTSSYHDFIELNSSATTINADTSRVDAFGLPLAIHLHNSNNTDVVVGEDDQVFAETRSALFTQFENAVPAAFQQLATVNAPYSIPAPSDVAAFQPGGADANYMVSYAASVGATETTQEVFGCEGGGSPALNGDPTLCAALNRGVAQDSTTVQNTPADYYKTTPYNAYSAFWHSVAVNGAQYGFAYDDVNGQSSDFNSTDASYVQVAIGW